MSPVLTPGIRFNQTPYIMVVGVASAMMALALWLFINGFTEDITFAQHEGMGVHEMHTISLAETRLKRIRGLSLLQDGGDDSVAAEREALTQGLVAQLKASLSDTHATFLHVATPLATLIARFNQLQSAEAKPLHGLALFDAYSDLISSLNDMRRLVGYYSNLAMDPAIQNHQLVVVMELLTAISEHEAKLRGLTSYQLQSASHVASVVTRINTETVLQRHHLDQLQIELQVLKVQGGADDEVIKTANYIVAHLREVISKGVGTATGFALARAHFEQRSQNVAIVNQLSLEIIKRLSASLEQRIYQLRSERLFATSVGVAALLALLAIITVLFRRNNRAILDTIISNQRLLKSEQEQRSVLDTVADGVIVIDESGLIVNFNHAAEKIFLYQPSEVIGKNVKVLMPEPYISEHDGYLERYKSTHVPRVIGIGREVKGLRKNGEIFPIELAVSEMWIDEQRFFTGIVRDITDRKAVEDELYESEVRTRTILETVLDGIITIDEKGLVQSFNKAAEGIFGYKAEIVIGQNVKMLMPAPFSIEHDTYLDNYKRTGEAKIIGIGREVVGQRSDGSTFPLDLAVSQMNLGGKRFYAGVVRDITERKRVDVMKNEFISTVSHELRTPLTSIRGAIGILSGGVAGELPEKAREMIKIARNNTERLLLLINDILDIQKIESGKMSFHFRNIDLMGMLEQIQRDLSSYCKERNIECVITQRLDGASLYADYDRVIQVMNNLISNAAKFSTPGERIEISAARHHDKRVRISVTDHGAGIPDEFKARMFERFSQADSSSQRAKGGTGLGLAITKAIVEKHGGTIDYVSRVGIGTTIFVEFPELEGSGTAAKPIVNVPHHDACILIIEDDHDVAAMLQRMLVQAGYNSDIAYTAAQAREYLRKNPKSYKLVTLDILLPDESGKSLLSTLRMEPATQDLPVLVVSAVADETRRELNGGAVGVMDWLQKPIDQERLIRMVRQVASPGKTPRVLHVEDEIDVHTIVKTMLQGECDLVWASSFSASKELLEMEDFDLVLLDIGLADGSGLDLLSVIETRGQPPQVVIFSAQEVTPEYAQRVSAVLVKSRTDQSALRETILSAIRDI